MLKWYIDGYRDTIVIGPTLASSTPMLPSTRIHPGANISPYEEHRHQRHTTRAHNMKVNDNQYVISDYEIGINLDFENQYLESDFYQVGNWYLAGTYSYHDPILEHQYQKASIKEVH